MDKLNGIRTVTVLVVLTALAAAAAPGGSGTKGNAKESPKESPKPSASGLVAHYFKDPTNWNGQWPDTNSVPLASPLGYTFTAYAYSRVEPLINHQFIREGWFTVRWVGCIDTSDARKGSADDEHDYTFFIWADDGCRLIVDGRVLIDDWSACCEADPKAMRKAPTIRLSSGPHRIVVEYFQGQSLARDDKDPIKLYWASESRGIPRQLVPAADFSHTAEDLLSYER